MHLVGGLLTRRPRGPDGGQRRDGTILGCAGQEVRLLAGHGKAVKSVAFSPDGRTALTGSDDRTARLWDTATGRELRRLAGRPPFLGVGMNRETWAHWTWVRPDG